MGYLIDTDWLIDFLTDSPEAKELLDKLVEKGIHISIITYMEVYQGVYRSPFPQKTESQLRELLEVIPVLDFSSAIAKRCARLRESLRKKGKRVNSRALDLIIAATALQHDLRLVTRNYEDYKDIPGLKVYRA